MLQVLQVDPETPLGDIKQKFRRVSFKFMPDLCPVYFNKLLLTHYYLLTGREDECFISSDYFA